MDKLKINGSLISLSESEDLTKKFAKFLLCPLDESNKNKVGIREKDISNEEFQTLIGQPLVCKVVVDPKTKEYDFSGHNMKRIKQFDEEGKEITIVDFDTSPIGFHTSVEVEDVEVEGITKRCLTATVTLWTRYYRALDVIERLGEKLRTSWEVSYDSFYTQKGVKWLKDIQFLANCCLGSNVTPAYSDAGLLEVAEENTDMQLAIAFMEDLQEEIESNVENSTEDIKNNNEGDEVIMSKEIKDKTEIASVTANDLYEKVRKAINATDENNYYYIARLYPYEYKAYAYNWNQDSEDSYIEFTYVVNSDDTVSITAQQDVKMVFIAKEVQETAIAELETKLSDKETELSTKVDEIIKLGETIQSKDTVISEKEAVIVEKDTIISELEPFKAQIEEIQAKEKEAEIAEAKEDLKQKALSSKYVTEEDLETSEVLKTAIENLDEKSVKIFIAEKVMEVANKQPEAIETSEGNAGIEVSETAKPVVKQELETNYTYNNEENAILNWIKK